MIKLKDSFPCKNCITFAVCKNQFVIESDNKFLDLAGLLGKCSLLRNWYYHPYVKEAKCKILRERYNVTLLTWF